MAQGHRGADRLAPRMILSGSNLSAAPHQILVTGQLLDAHRTTRVEFVGADADFRAHPEFTAVGELRGRIVQHDGAVDPRENALGGFRVAGHDAVGVRRAILVNVSDGRVHSVDHPDRDDGVEILRVPILLAGGYDALVDPRTWIVAAHFPTRVEQQPPQRPPGAAGARAGGP